MKLTTISLLLLISANPTLSQSTFWEPTNGPGDKEVRSLAADPHGHIFAGTSCKGVYRSTDNGSSWMQINAGLTDSSVHALAVHAGQLLAGTRSGGSFRSTDEGEDWSNVLAGEMFVLEFAFNSSGDGFAGIAGNPMGGSWGGVFSSSNSGGPWSYSSLHLISGLCINSKGNIIASGQAGSLGTPFGIFRSTDNGASWTNVYPLSNFSLLQPFTANPKGQLFWSGETLMTSTDDGQHWSALQEGPGQACDLVTSSSGHIFAATSGGVYRSTDDGKSWSALNDGLTDTTVYALAIDSAGHMYAGTSSGIVFRSIQSATSVNALRTALPSAFSLEQNYPNPFNPSTSIRYSVPQKADIQLTVFNALGQEVVQLVNGEVEAGSHEVRFDGSGLASGVYLYRLSAGRFVETKKLLLLR